MKKLLVVLAFAALGSLPARAQFSSFPRVEVGGGYMFRSYNAQYSDRVNFNGWFATGDFNIANWLGVAADIDGGYSSPTGIAVHQYTYLFGPRIYPMGHHKFTPFVHALFGLSSIVIPSSPPTDNAFGWEVGGGLDVSVMPHIALRVGEFDFEQTRNFNGGTAGNPNQNNYKYKGGVIFRF